MRRNQECVLYLTIDNDAYVWYSYMMQGRGIIYKNQITLQIMETQNNDLFNSTPQAPKPQRVKRTKGKKTTWLTRPNIILLSIGAVLAFWAFAMLFSSNGQYDAKMKLLRANSALWHQYENNQSDLEKSSDEIRTWFEAEGFEVFQSNLD